MNTNHKKLSFDVSEDNANGVNYALQRTRWFLKILGIWPYVTSNPTKLDRYLWKLFLPIPPFFVMLTLIGGICHVVLRDLDRQELISDCGRIIYLTANLMKNVILFCRHDAVKYCVQHMETDWRKIENDDDRDIMMRNLRIGRRWSAICFVCMYTSAIIFDTMPLYVGIYVNEFNQSVRQLVFPGYDTFVDLQVGYNWEMVFCCQSVSAFFLHFIVIAVCDLAAILVCHACGQIQLVMSRLESLVGKEKQNNDIVAVENRISFVIQTHVRTLRFAARIDELLRDICLMEIFSSTLMICWIEYFCLSELENNRILAMGTYLLPLVSVVFNTYIFCHIGEILKEQCQQIGKAAYMIEWFELPGKTALTLLMIMGISDYPRKLTAGKVMELSHYSFGNIMRTSLAYLNILRQMAPQ